MKSAKDTVIQAVDAARRSTGLALVVQDDKTGGLHTIEVPAPGRKQQFQVVTKNVDRFAVPALIKARERAGGRRLVLVAPYVTGDMAQRCRELKLPFIDTAGNAYFDGTGLFIYVVGLPKPEEMTSKPYRAITTAGLQVAFALLSEPRLLQASQREIARCAGVALGSVGPVMKDLQQRHYLGGRKPKLINADRLLDEFVTHYPMRLRPKLLIRRFSAEPAGLRQLNIAQYGALWGGEVAADRLTHYLKPQQFTIYTREPITKLVAAARMKVDPDGNLEVLRRFWQFEAEPSRADVVPAILVYADLLATNEPRNLETAKLVHEQHIAPALLQTAQPA
ncbi:hypothetical protein F183_A29070 [Bryobacterales bacterium F-183]|nr:hypothetical protein F183_A29070 [Bryobacterales bacterium F-183]